VGRPAIPSDIALRLRQEAGFGCCKCGYPFYEYHHIVEFSRAAHYRFEDMLVLCPNCHKQATSKAMSEKEQRFYKRHPFNINKGYADGQLKIDQRALVVSGGTVQFIRDGFIFRVDQEDLLSISLSEVGQLEISLKLYSKKNNLLAEIERNDWKTGEGLPWDLESGWRWMRLRNRKYDVAVEIDARRMPVEIRGNLWLRSQHFELTGRGIKFNGTTGNLGMSNLCLVAVYLRADSKLGRFEIVPDERFGEGKIISWPDLPERIQKGLNAWDVLVNGHTEAQ
jgi:hypothetical protein